MRLNQRTRRRNLSRNAKCLAKCLIDALEPRRLFDGETAVPIPSILANTANPAGDSVPLSAHFSDSLIPGTAVIFSTTLGTIDVALTDAATPVTVANFLSYVNSNAYNDTFFHRSVDLNTNLGGTPEAPGTIIQGGGYYVNSSSGSAMIDHIPTAAAIPDEFNSEILTDVAGTIAMAKTSDANTATSEFFFNVSDNTELDTPTTDSNGVQTSYTVFGTILGQQSGETIDAIAALPTTSLGSGLDTVPVNGLSETQLAAGAQAAPSNLVFINSATSQPGTTYNVSSDNKALVAPTVSDGNLTFTYGTGSGTADITVIANNLDGTSATTTFAVTVPNPATPGAGPVANPFSAPFVVTGNTQTFSVLAPDTDSLSPLEPTSVTIVNPPTHGTATVDPSSGMITYTPDATGTPPYTGNDTLTYTVTDAAGRTSAPGTVTLDVVPTAVKVSVGTTARIKSLNFTQPDGVTGHLTVINGTATVTFTNFQVTTTTKAGVITATGAGATITDITFTDNNKNRYVSLSVTSNGPVALGSVNYGHIVGYIYAPNGTLSGTSSFGQIQRIEVAAAVGATITLGSGFYSDLLIPNVTNTNIIANNIAIIESKQWLVTDGQTHSITATNISELLVPGEFDESLALDATGYGIFLAKVGTANAGWGLSGSIFKATLGTPGANWELQCNGLVRTLAIKGNLKNNQITAAAITTMTVSGTTDGAVVQTDATFSTKFNQIQKIAFAGAVTDTVIFSAGNIGSISAPSLTGSRIYAGVDIEVAKAGSVATSAANISNDAKITSISLGRGAAAFSNSLISADILGSVQLGKITSSNGGSSEGVSAHTLGSIHGTLVPGGLFSPGRADLKNAAALQAYITRKKLAVGDFRVALF